MIDAAVEVGVVADDVETISPPGVFSLLDEGPLVGDPVLVVLRADILTHHPPQFRMDVERTLSVLTNLRLAPEHPHALFATRRTLEGSRPGDLKPRLASPVHWKAIGMPLRRHLGVCRTVSAPGIPVLTEVRRIGDGLSPSSQTIEVHKSEVAIVVIDGDGRVARLVEPLRRAEE